MRPFHDLRHTSLTNEAAAGSTPIALMAKAGHADMKVTRRYLQPDVVQRKRGELCGPRR